MAVSQKRQSSFSISDILEILGTLASPQAVTAAGGIEGGSKIIQKQFVVSSGGAVTVTANPQVAAGPTVGTRKTIIGTSNTHYPILNTGNGLKLNGPMILRLGSEIDLDWDGTTWTEGGRNEI